MFQLCRVTSKIKKVLLIIVAKNISEVIRENIDDRVKTNDQDWKIMSKLIYF